jgi:hypothetical protein
MEKLRIVLPRPFVYSPNPSPTLPSRQAEIWPIYFFNREIKAVCLRLLDQLHQLLEQLPLHHRLSADRVGTGESQGFKGVSRVGADCLSFSAAAMQIFAR